MLGQPCLNCGHLNRLGARFCASCRTPLPRSGQSAPAGTGLPCPYCRTVNSSTARFCNACGRVLQLALQHPKGTTGALSLHAALQNGRYVVEGLLGKGGMGAVYKVHDTRLQNKYWAIKEMSIGSLLTIEELHQGIEAFRREAAMLAHLNHRNLPKVIDNFAENGREYLVMELVEGQTLSAVLTRGNKPLQIDQITDWAKQLCEVLDYLHNQRPAIIFRDLKPDNIMIDRNGVIKLIDFGIARHFKPGQKADTTAFGTAGYAPPEQYGKGQTDVRSDIYSLAATLHQLLTLRDPSQDPFNFPPARQLNPNVPEGLSAALQKALSHSPTDRWANMADFCRALCPPVQSPSVSPPIVTPSVPPVSSTSQTPAVMPPAAAPPVQATSGISRRAGWLAYLVAVGVLAWASMLLQRLDLSTTIWELTGYGALGYPLHLTLVWIPPVLAYLLTRRPLASFFVFAIGWGVDLFNPSTYLDIESFMKVLIIASVMEATFLLSGYRTRGIKVGIVAAIAGSVAAIVLFTPPYLYADVGYLTAATLLTGLVGGALAALLAIFFGRG